MIAPNTQPTNVALRPTAALVLPPMAGTSPALQQTLQQIVERLAVLDGQRGNELDSAVTRRELLDGGLAKLGRNASGTDSLIPVFDSSEWTNIPYLDSMPTPTAPLFTTTIGANYLLWQLPNARGVGSTEIYRHTNNNDGAIVGAVVGSQFVDFVDAGITYYYKIRFVSELGVAGDWSSEVSVKAEDDPAELVSLLQGQIRESELATALRDKVKTGGTFETAIKNEATTRKTATDSLASSINTVSANLNNVSAAVQEEVTARVAADGQVVAKFSSKATAGGRTAGFSFGSDGNVSEFYIMADQFAVLHQDGGTQNVTEPFIIKKGKTYLSSAVIEDASISTAKIAELNTAVANIAKATIYNAAVGGQIYSSNYNLANKTGWSLKQDGSAFFGSNVTFGGRLSIGKAGQANGVVINNDGIYVYDRAGKLRVAIGKLA